MNRTKNHINSLSFPPFRSPSLGKKKAPTTPPPPNTKQKNQNPESNLQEDTSVRNSQDHFSFSFIFTGKLPA